MPQIASLLVVATVFTWLMICKNLHFTVRGGEGGGLICETKLPMQELELKMQGGLLRDSLVYKWMILKCPQIYIYS